MLGTLHALRKAPDITNTEHNNLVGLGLTAFTIAASNGLKTAPETVKDPLFTDAAASSMAFSGGSSFVGGGRGTQKSFGLPQEEAEGQITTGGSVGAMSRNEYEGVIYHGPKGVAPKSKGPQNGQDALDTSVEVRPTSSRRIGIDYEKGEFVVFDKTINNIYHGHVRDWNELSSEMQNALRKAGMTDKNGKIMRGGK